MQAGIEAAQQGPWRGILLVGDEPYYARVGFFAPAAGTGEVSRSRGSGTGSWACR